LRRRYSNYICIFAYSLFSNITTIVFEKVGGNIIYFYHSLYLVLTIYSSSSVKISFLHATSYSCVWLLMLLKLEFRSIIIFVTIAIMNFIFFVPLPLVWHSWLFISCSIVSIIIIFITSVFLVLFFSDNLKIALHSWCRYFCNSLFPVLKYVFVSVKNIWISFWWRSSTLKWYSGRNWYCSQKFSSYKVLVMLLNDLPLTAFLSND